MLNCYSERACGKPLGIWTNVQWSIGTLISADISFLIHLHKSIHSNIKSVVCQSLINQYNPPPSSEEIAILFTCLFYELFICWLIRISDSFFFPSSTAFLPICGCSCTAPNFRNSQLNQSIQISGVFLLHLVVKHVSGREKNSELLRSLPTTRKHKKEVIYLVSKSVGWVGGGAYWQRKK